MFAMDLLQNHLASNLPSIHATRLQSLFDVACALQKGKKLTLTALGRKLNSGIKIKNKVKKVDRLESNKNLHNELNDIYQGLSSYVFRYTQHHTVSPIVVDLCYMQDNHGIQMLSAEIGVKGRTLPLYREIFKENELKGRAQSFLDNLKKCIPSDRKPVLVMDAAFGENWFKEIERLGWYWLVRVRQGKSIKLGTNDKWLSIRDLIPSIGVRAKSYEVAFLSKSYERPCRLVTKKNHNQDKNSSKLKTKSDSNKSRCSYSTSAREPWILATNLPSEYKTANVLSFYKKRMQIEESFRDIKNHQFGLSARYVKTKCVHRWGVKMLLAAIVQITLWVIGIIGHSQGFQKVFQTNTVKNKKVFSYFYLGSLIVEFDKLHDLKFNIDDLPNIIDQELAKEW